MSITSTLHTFVNGGENEKGRWRVWGGGRERVAYYHTKEWTAKRKIPHYEGESYKLRLMIVAKCKRSTKYRQRRKNKEKSEE